MRTRWRLKWRWLLLTTAAIVIALLVTGWLMFQRIPSWYRPVSISQADLQGVKNSLLDTFRGLSASMVETDVPFEHRFTCEQVNAWWTVREEIWPMSREWLPDFLSHPFVMIDEEGIRLAATYRHGGLRTVISTRLKVQADQDGIHVRLIDVSTGLLAVPQSWIRERLVKLDESRWPAGQRIHSQYDHTPLPGLSGLFEGITLPNAWIWENGERPFRIISLRSEPGALVVTFEPLPRQESTLWSS